MNDKINTLNDEKLLLKEKLTEYSKNENILKERL